MNRELHALALGEAMRPRCTGYCIGTKSATTLVEDLACPVHGIEAQERARELYPDRDAWLASLSVPVPQEKEE